jgi:hypothetical protein
MSTSQFEVQTMLHWTSLTHSSLSPPHGKRFSLTSFDFEATDTEVEHALLIEALSGDCEVHLSCLPHPI